MLLYSKVPDKNYYSIIGHFGNSRSNWTGLNFLGRLDLD